MCQKSGPRRQRVMLVSHFGLYLTTSADMAVTVYRLSRTCKLDAEAKWLFSLLQAFGDILETWGLGSSPCDPEAPQTSNPHYAPAAGGVPLTLQYTTSTASRAPAQTMSDSNFTVMAELFPADRPLSYFSAPTAGASQAWGRDALSLPAGHPPSVPDILSQLQFVYQQPAHLAIPAATAHPSSAAAGDGPSSSVRAPVAPTPVNPRKAPGTPGRPPYRGGSMTCHTSGMPSSRESLHPMQAMALPSFDNILLYEYLRLLQMQYLGERAKDLMELLYRTMYMQAVNTGKLFPHAQLSPHYALVISDIPKYMDQFVLYMHWRFRHELGLIMKVM